METFAELKQRVEACLAELEAALDRAPPDAEAARRRLAEIRALLARQAEGRDDLASLADYLQTRHERDKAALARELHDALGGILTPAKMDVAWLEERLADDAQYGARVRRLNSLIDQGIDLKRRIIEALRPSLLDHLGLASALQWYVEEASRQAHLQSRVDIATDIGRFSPDLEIALYRIVQACLANTVAHARAKTFELAMNRRTEGLRLEMGDDGAGIADVRKALVASHGFANMIHRIRSMNGTFDIESAPGAGTRVIVFVPMDSRGQVTK